jgi:hypothetical protein
MALSAEDVLSNVTNPQLETKAFVNL